MIFSLVILLNTIRVFGQTSNELYVGTSKINITPNEPVYLSGYGGMYSNRITDQIHDSLYCRVTALKYDQKKVVFISTDLIGSYFYEEVYEVLQSDLGLKQNEVFLTAIHTHSAPVFTFSEEDKQTANFRYTSDLVTKISTAVQEALSSMQTVDIGILTGYSPIGINRRALSFDPNRWPFDGGLIKMGRNPGGIVNNEVVVLKLENARTGFKTCMFEYGCHARSQSPGSKIITGDFFGIAEQKAEQIIGEDVIVSGFAGASGEIDPIYVLGNIHEEENWIPEIELMGQLLAQEVVRNFRSINEPIQIKDLKSDFRTLQLPSRSDDEYITNDSIPKTPLNITVASLNDIAFIGIGSEVSVEIGNKIKEASPFKHNFIMTHCNGGAGYLSPMELYSERGYEVSNSPFGPEAADIVVKETLKSLYNQKDNR